LLPGKLSLLEKICLQMHCDGESRHFHQEPTVLGTSLSED
jgi:hypothetical protein